MSPLPRKLRYRVWLPVILFLVSGTLTLILWKVLADAEDQRMRLETQVTAEQVKLRLEAWFDTRAALLTHFAEDWSIHLAHGGADFTAQAQRIVELFPGFQALNLMDENWVIRVVVPLEGNQGVLGKDLHNHPAEGVREGVPYALKTRAIHRTPLVLLLQGEPGFATYVPIYLADGRLAGFINGVFGVDELVNSCLSEPNLRERFQFRLVTPDGREAYKHYESDFNTDQVPVAALPVRIVDGDWTLEIALSRQGVATARTRADEFLVAIGFGLSLLLAIMLRAYQVRQAELDEGREQYRLLVENQADFLVKIDSTGRVVFVSPSFCRFTGRSEEDLLGQEFLDLVLEKDLPVARELISAENGQVGTAEWDFRLKGGTGEIWTGWSAAPFQGASGEWDGIVGVGRDITQRRELEAQLRVSQRLQAVGQLAGGIAHDFNNILQAIQGYIEFVKEDLPQDSESYRDLDQAGLASQRAAVLVRQLLAFSRRQILEPVNLDLNQVMAGMMSMLERVIGPTIPINLHAQENLWLVKADQGQVEQILMNLAVNARDAMAAGGRIDITTSNHNLDEAFCRRHFGKAPGYYVRLDIADTGVGMEKKVLDQLFEPFFTTKESGTGTGLGLATVYGIVKQHDGMILVESEPGQGTRFSIYLPRAEGSLENQDIQPDALASQGQETILFAEDEPLLRKLGLRILQSAGYQVLAAEDGQEAWEIFQDYRQHIDLAVLDVVMPKVDGRELAERIRQKNADLPLVFVSGYDSDTARGRQGTFPRSVRVPKPYNRNDLLAAIRKVIEGNGVGLNGGGDRKGKNRGPGDLT